MALLHSGPPEACRSLSFERDIATKIAAGAPAARAAVVLDTDLAVKNASDAARTRGRQLEAMKGGRKARSVKQVIE